MTSDPTPTPRERCIRCQQPVPTCLCRWITPTVNRVPLLLLQHPLELRQAKGSARLLRLSLADCRCEIGEQFDVTALATWLGSGAALLYPGGTAMPPIPPQRLVLLDGTWRKTRKLLHLNPLLQALPRVALQEPPPSRYSIRKAQAPQQRSTLEAACLALGQIEARTTHYAPLLQAFDGWVQWMKLSGQARRNRSENGEPGTARCL